MARVRKPFKRFNSNDSVLAVQLTSENIEELAIRFGGKIEDHVVGEGFEDTLRLPSLYQPHIVPVGYYIFVTEDGTLDSISEEAFEEEWVVPNGRRQNQAKEEYEKENVDGESNA